MKTLGIFLFAAFMSLTSLYGLDFQLGPFSLQLGGPGYVVDRTVVNDPICYAISNNKKLEVVVKVTEKINAKEIRTVTKQIIIEPYAFGWSKDKQPVLRGNIVDEKLIKEVNVKYAEDRFTDDNANKPERRGLFGFFKSKNSDSKDQIDIRGVVSILPLEDSHFDAPKDFDKTFNEDFIEIVCKVRPSNPNGK